MGLLLFLPRVKHDRENVNVLWSMLPSPDCGRFLHVRNLPFGLVAAVGCKNVWFWHFFTPPLQQWYIPDYAYLQTRNIPFYHFLKRIEMVPWHTVQMGDQRTDKTTILLFALDKNEHLQCRVKLYCLAVYSVSDACVPTTNYCTILWPLYLCPVVMQGVMECAAGTQTSDITFFKLWRNVYFSAFSSSSGCIFLHFYKMLSAIKVNGAACKIFEFNNIHALDKFSLHTKHTLRLPLHLKIIARVLPLSSHLYWILAIQGGDFIFHFNFRIDLFN